jgi:hypothetical protein
MQQAWRDRLEVLKQNWAPIALGFGALALIVGAAYWQSYAQTLPVTVERGTVLRFGGSAFDDGDHLLVVVRTADGSVLNLPASLARLRGCRAGGTIMLLRRGGRISGLARMPCRIREGVDPR